MIHQRLPSFFDDDDSGAIKRIMESESHQLLIPPKFTHEEVTVSEEDFEHSDELLIGLFSSGSTGQPKTILNAKKHILANSRASIDHFGFKSDHKILILASPWHVAGLTWAMAAEFTGADYQIVPPYADNIEIFHQLLLDYQPDILCTVPSVLSLLLDYKDWNIPHIIAGGASLEPQLYPKLEQSCDIITQAYGQTESGGLISSISFSPCKTNPEADFNNVGKPLAEIDLSLEKWDESENDSKSIVLTSPYAVRDGNYRSGDLGFMDKQGNLHLTGRSDKKDGGNCNALSGMTMVLHK